MAAQPDLVKIGKEGFAIIETFYGAPTRRSTKRQGRWGLQDQYSVSSKEEAVVINSKDAASKYGGIMVVNYPKTKPQSRWGKIFQALK
ncbi:hypothetical protein SESBI_24152 [Sesbania bispinosa]|nr:hypothetical protein SESBI_24152 [Sesbania bispinosa]